MSDPNELVRQENEHLKEEIAKQEAVIAKQTSELAHLSQLNQKPAHYIRGLVRGRYGRSSEKLLGDPPTDQQLIAEVEAFLNDERAQNAAPPAAAVPVAPAPTEPADPPDGSSDAG